MVRLGLLVCLVIPCFVTDTKDDTAKKELDKLQGAYVMEALEVDGQQVPAEKLKGTTLEIKGDKYIVTVGKSKHEMTIKIDPSKKPAEIDMVATDGANKDKAHPGIYRIVDGKLEICRAQAAEKDRPRDFGSWPDTGVFLVTWKRQ